MGVSGKEEAQIQIPENKHPSHKILTKDPVCVVETPQYEGPHIRRLLVTQGAAAVWRPWGVLT